ncbi:hypothetical protein PENFLA_c081G09454 [Penicillium flavigenum]|uniref:Uncharacterized protein n=1 Tax=Penicillium flavigenum TaxID=254877 RepID=A0A1V6SA02_9EURO|nr:hypothetical protein PENFLA_c081G09454 [Penicillium flavigenum]
MPRPLLFDPQSATLSRSARRRTKAQEKSLKTLRQKFDHADEQYDNAVKHLRNEKRRQKHRVIRENLEDVLVVFDLLEFVLGGCDGRGLLADDVLQRADQSPHLLGGDSTGWIRRSEDIATPGSLPVFDGSSGFEVILREAGGDFLRAKRHNYTAKTAVAKPSRVLGTDVKQLHQAGLFRPLPWFSARASFDGRPPDIEAPAKPSHPRCLQVCALSMHQHFS